MRYAAKRIWPDRPKAWEHQGEAENLEAFALAFASDRGLGSGTEFEVLDKDSDDATLVSFRVEGTLPYTLGPVVTHLADQARSDGLPPPPFMAPALSFFFYMAKVAVFTVAVLVVLFWLIKKYGS